MASSSNKDTINAEIWQTDYYILYDAESTDDSSKQYAEIIGKELHESGYTGAIQPTESITYTRGCLNNKVTKAEFVICLINIKNPNSNISETFENHIKWAIQAKLQQEQDNRFIPAIAANTESDASTFMKCTLPASLVLLKTLRYVITCTSRWIMDIKTMITEVPSRNNLQRRYDEILPNQCDPFLRMKNLPGVQHDVFQHYMPPQLRIKDILNKKVIHEAVVNKSIDEVIEDHCKGAFVGDVPCPQYDMKRIRQLKCILITASAGMGKSAMALDMVRKWNGRTKVIGHFPFCFLICPRYILSHGESLERIISNDLQLLPREAEPHLQQTFADFSHQACFVIDGFDEMTEKEKRRSSIKCLIQRKVAPGSLVIVLTRPQCVDELIQLMGGSCMLINLEPLSVDQIHDYIQHTCVLESNDRNGEMIINNVYSSLPSEFMKVPLLMKLACLLWKWKRRTLHSEAQPNIRTMTHAITGILQTFVDLQLEKKDGKISLKKFPSHVDTYSEDKKHDEVLLFHSICKLSFDSILQNSYVFNQDTLQYYALDSEELLLSLGVIIVDKDRRGRMTASFIHSIMMEYCAAYHISRDEDAVDKLLGKIDGSCKGMEQLLGHLSNVLIFAVGINCTILEKVDQYKTFIPQVFAESESCMNKDLNIAYEASLVHECDKPDVRKRFCRSLLSTPIADAVMMLQGPLANTAAYCTLRQEMGLLRILQLLQNVHSPEKLIITNQKAELNGVHDKRVITDTLLMSSLQAISLVNTKRIYVKFCSLYFLPLIPRRIIDQISNRAVEEVIFRHTSFTEVELATFLRLINTVSRVKRLVIHGECQLSLETRKLPNTVSRRQAVVEAGGIEITITTKTLLRLLGAVQMDELWLIPGCQLLYDGDTSDDSLTGVKHLILSNVRGVRFLEKMQPSLEMQKVTINGWHWGEGEKIEHSRLKEMFPNATITDETQPTN